MVNPARRPGHPPWCERDRQSAVGRHVSAEVRVGRRRPGCFGDRGEVAVYLAATGGGPAWLVVNAAHMVGVTVEVSLDDAVRLRDGLTRLLRQAGHE